MLRFRGSPALSPFRLEKLLAALRQRVPVITTAYAEFAHFLDGTLSVYDREVLDRLLRYGPAATPHDASSGPVFLVIPRPGTISPWSSKATDIARNCGLRRIRRIERGIAYYLEFHRPLTDGELAELKPLLHDRMTETVLGPNDDPAALFAQAEPAPLATVDVLEKLWTYSKMGERRWPQPIANWDWRCRTTKSIICWTALPAGQLYPVGTQSDRC